MDVKITAWALRGLLGSVMGGVDRKNTRPILSNYLITAYHNKLCAQATDGHMSIKREVPAEVIQDGEFCISAKSFFEVARELPEGEVKLSYAEVQQIPIAKPLSFDSDSADELHADAPQKLDASEESKVKAPTRLLSISTQDLIYSLVTSSTDEFPKLFIPSDLPSFSLSGQKLSHLVNKTFHAISSDDTRYNLNGIFLQIVDGHLRAVATDGHVLALSEDFESQITLQSSPLNPLLVGVIIPKKGVIELKKLVEEHPQADFAMSFDESTLYVCYGDEVSLSIRLITRDYPKYETVIPNKTTYQVNINREGLISAVKRIRILANEKSNGIKISLSPSLSEGAPAQMLVSATHPSLGDAQERLEVEYIGNPVDIGFNAKYLVDTFGAIPDDHLSMLFNNEFGPVLIKSQNANDFLGIVMPLRL